LFALQVSKSALIRGSVMYKTDYPPDRTYMRCITDSGT
jgi:hypothetical protein